MNQAPPEALEILKARPETAPQFNNKFGYLPEGVELPKAPAEAIEYLSANPATAPQFRRRFGYLPAPESAIAILRERPETQDQFKAKFGYVPDLEPTAGERLEAGVKDVTAGLLRLARNIPTVAIEAFTRSQGKQMVPERVLQTEGGMPRTQPATMRDRTTPIERLLPDQALPALTRSAEQLETDFDGTIEQIKESLPESVKAARSGPIVTKDKDGKLDVHWENINVDVLSQLAAESIAYAGGVFKLAGALGGGASAAGAANSVLISAETVHDTRQKIMAKLEKRGIRGDEAEVLANKATERAVQIIAPVAFLTGRFGEGSAIATRALTIRGTGTAAARGAASETLEETVQTATPAIATGEAPKSEELLASAIVAPLAGGVQSGVLSAASAYTNQLKQKAMEGPPTAAIEGAPEDRRAQDSTEPRERRVDTAERARVDNLQKRVAAIQDDIKGGRATEDALAPLLDELVKVAYTDDLTGLHNYRAFHDFVAENPNHSVMYLDLDDFKNLNTQYGHAGGDVALKEVGKIMRQIGDEMGVIPFRRAKQGAGDEFLATHNDPDVLKEYGKRVQDTLDSTKLEIINKKGEQLTLPGIGSSYGVDTNENAAEVAGDADKDARTKAGKRTGVRTPAPAADLAAPTGEPAGPSANIEGGQVDVTSDQIQAARPAPSTATVQSTLYGGLPVDRIAGAARDAAVKAHDALGIPLADIDIADGQRSAEPGVGSAFVSPTTLIKKYPKFGKYIGWARKAFEIQEGLRNAFRARLDKVDKILGGGSLGRFSEKYQKNKETLSEIRWTEDALGKNLTAKQMKEEFGASPEVITAHKLIRSAYDHALTMANKVRELRGQTPVNRREGYVPHFFHNFFIIADEQIVGSSKTLADAVAASNQLKRKGKTGLKIRPKQFQFPGEGVQAAVMGDMDYFKVQKQIQAEMEMTPAEAEGLLDGIIRRKGRSRFVGNFFQRKGVAGYEQDLDWIDRHYFNMIARYTALDGFKRNAINAYEREFGAFDKDKKGLAKVVKDYINDINGVPSAAEELINNTLANVPGFSKFLGRYLGDRPALQVAGGLAGATAILKLGLYNTATALVNGSQLIGAYSLLGERYFIEGKARAIRALAGKSSTDKGILKQAGVDTDLGLESASGYSKASEMGALFQSSTYFFSSVEKYVRATTALGAYYKAKAGGASHTESIDFAKGINRRVNFDYSIVDAPNFIRRSGPVGTLLFQFKKFPVKMLEFMVSLKGAEHARFWIPIFLLAGYHAIPGLEAVKELVKATFGFDMELELKKYLMDWAGDDKEKMAVAKTVMYGAFSHDPAGVDISQRIGGGDFIPSRASDLFGAFFSSTVRAAQMAAEENWPEALRAIASSPGNIWMALDQDKFSRSATDRDRPISESNAADKIKKAVGFRPTLEAIETDVKRVIDYESEQYRQMQARIVDQIIDASLTYAKTVEAMKAAPGPERTKLLADAKTDRDQAMAEVLSTMTQNGIVITPTQVENEILQKNLTRSERAFLNASDIIKGKTMNIYRFSRGQNDKE
jgi:diguanylate cyclase (GGDEF)-like protein